jgi:hypothetical protein
LEQILEQTLLTPMKTRLHDDVLGVLALHSSPSMPLPRLRMLAVLYHVLGCVPQYQARVVPLLNELCKGLEAGDLAEALGGVYSEHAHVRCACLNAVMHVPALSKQAAPEDSNVATTLWISQYDSEMVSLFVLFEHQNFTFI